jgi:hypothetical protein
MLIERFKTFVISFLVITGILTAVCGWFAAVAYLRDTHPLAAFIASLGAIATMGAAFATYVWRN